MLDLRNVPGENGRFRFFYMGRSTGAVFFVYKVYPDTMDGDVRTLDEKRERFFVETVREKRQAMWRAAYGILRSKADAEDAVSIAVEKTWKRLRFLRRDEALPRYLMQGAINAARDECRRRQRFSPLDALDREPAAPEKERGIADYVGELPEKYRLPLLLKFDEGLLEKEIAAILRLPRGTVSSRIVRGLAILRKEMEEEEAGHD